MKYYTINWDDNLKNVGYHPQTEIKRLNEVSTLYNHYDVEYNSFPDFIPNLELELHKKAKQTDYLNAFSISFGMIINDKFKSILEDFNLPSHAFYPIKVHQEKSVFKYYWFHYIVDLWKYIDVQKSFLQVYKKFEFEVEKVIPIPKKPEEIEVIKSSLPRQKELMIHKIIFKDTFPKYDVFNLPQLGYSPNLIS